MQARLAVPFLLVVSLGAGSARAIPAFARRYKTACTTCHTLPPQLSSYGLAFRANGYRLPAGEARRQQDDVALGAPEWEELFPRSFLPGTIADVPPLAGYLRAALESHPAQGGGKRSEEIDLAAVLLSGGNLGKRASYFVSAYATPQGAGLGRAIVSIDQLFGLGPFLNARVGVMEPGLVPWSRFTHRLTYGEYRPFETQVGLLELGASRPSVEVFGAGSDPGPLRGLRYTVGLAAREAGGLAADGYGRVSYKFGGLAAAGERGEGTMARPLEPLAETSLQVGAYAYRASLGGPASRARASRVGADATLRSGDLELMAGGWAGQDDTLAGTSAAYLAGASLRTFPWLMLLLRYEGLEPGVGASSRRVVAAVRGALQQNVSLTLEAQVEVPDAAVGGVLGVFLAF